MTARRPVWALRLLFRAPALFYAANCGWLLGHRFLLLMHTGRRTGRRHRTVLEVIEYREEIPEAVVMCAFGPNADWLRNIEATPNPEVVIGSRHFIVAYRYLDEAEASGVLARYLRHNRLIVPIIRLVLSRLLGWHFDGSDEHCRRLAGQLPLIAFRPCLRAAVAQPGTSGACKRVSLQTMPPRFPIVISP